MFRLYREWIQKNLDNPNITWTERQREMLTGMAEYTESVGDEFESVADNMQNPGPPPEPSYDKPPQIDPYGDPYGN